MQPTLFFCLPIKASHQIFANFKPCRINDNWVFFCRRFNWIFFLSARLIAETNSTETAVDGKLCTVCIIYTAIRRNFSSHSNVVRLKIHSPMYKYVFSFDWILKRNEERKSNLRRFRLDLVEIKRLYAGCYNCAQERVCVCVSVSPTAFQSYALSNREYIIGFLAIA